MSEMAVGTELRIDTTIPPGRDPGEGFKRPRPPLLKMDEAMKARVRVDLFFPTP